MILSKIALTTVLFCFVTFALQRFKLCTFESDHLFLFDANWIIGHLREVGGLNLIISSFLTQFFKFPIVGTIVATIIYVSVVYCTNKLISLTTETEDFHILAIVPATFLLLCIEIQFYSFRGHTALAICMIVTVLYQSFTNQHKKYDLAAAVLCTLLLYIIAGSVAAVFAAIVFVTGFLQNKKTTAGIVAIATLIICGFASYLLEQFVSFSEAISPIQYYNWPAPTMISICTWLSVPAVILLSKFIYNQKFNLTLFAALLLVFGFGLFKLHDLETYKMQHECYLAENEKWDKILAMNHRKSVKTNFISYTNLALAMRGELLDRMFEFNQQLPTQITNSRTVRNDILHMDVIVYYHIGHLALARKYAYNSSQITPGGIEPHHFTRLIAINNVLGLSKVSEKHSLTLHKTLFYKNIPQKDNISNYSARLPRSNNFCEMFGFAHDCREIIATNPENAVAQQFLTAYILLSADKNRLIEYLNEHKGQTLHRRIEEACTIMFSTDECRSYGVSESVINDFERLKKGLGINNFHKTYWYYIAYLKNTLKTQ